MTIFRVSTQNGPENFTGSFEILNGGVLEIRPQSGFRQLMAPGYWLRIEVSTEA